MHSKLQPNRDHAEERPATGSSRVGILAVVTAAFVGCLVLSGCRDELPSKPAITAGGGEPRPATSSPATIPDRDLQRKRILLVQSYHPEYPWVDTITKGIRSTLDQTGADLQIFYMDTKRHTDEEWKSNAGKRATARVDEYKPDAVLTIDDDAQNYFARNYVNTGLPIVFCGVDADPSKYGYPAPNVTGVIERPHFRESLALARRIRPMNRIAVMSCHDSTSIAALGFMKQEQLDVEVVEWLMVDDFDQWKEAITRFNTQVDALVIRSYQAVKQPGSRENVAPKEVVEWTAENATIPTIAFHDFEIADGILVGVVKSGEEYGRQAAEYILRILGGESPDALPVTRTKMGIRMINRRTADHLGIKLTDGMTSGTVIVPGT